MKLNYKEAQERFNVAKKNSTKWKSILDECYEYFLPEKDMRNNPGEKTRSLYDSTSVDSLHDYASRMEAQLVPPGRRWMTLEAGSAISEDEEDEVNVKLEEMTETLFEHINSSNFSSQISECFMDLGISTGAIIVDAGDGIQSSLRFRSVPLQEISIARTTSGIVETVFREITIPFSDMERLFPLAFEKMSDDDKSDYRDKPETDITLVEGVIRTNDKVNPYTSVVLYEAKSKLLQSIELVSSPWIVFRESTTAGEAYGRGRAMRCLADTKTLNTVMQYYMESCELLANPIYTAIDDGIINPATIVVKPKSIIPIGMQGSLQALPQAGDPRLNIDLMNRLQDSIRRTMMSKPFGKIDETPVRTATEMTIRNNDLAQTSGSSAGRIQTELLERLIARCVYLLTEAGKIAEFKVNGQEVKIRFTNPSAKLQDEADLMVLNRFLGTIGEMDPAIVQAAVKMEDIPKYVANTLGLSSTLLRTSAEKSEMEQRREQQLAEAQAQEMNKGQL